MHDTYNVDMTCHRSKLLSQSDVDSAAYIIPVKRDLGRYISNDFSNAKDKIVNFSKDIPDPWHQPVEVFRHCAANIDKMLDEIINKIVEELGLTV
jgi:protein-tyrosine-phosphatase